MKTVLFLLDRYPAFGGIETVTTILANALVKRYRVIICAQRSQHKEELLQKLAPQVQYYSLPHAELRYDEENLAAFRQILERERVDVVIYQDSYAPIEYLPLSISKESGVKLIVAEHSSPSHSRHNLQRALTACPKWNILKLAKLFVFGNRGCRRNAARRTALYKHCDRYIILSQALRKEFIQNSHVDDTAKLDVIGNPVSYTPQHIEQDAKKKQVLFFGPVVNLLGIDRLLRIWQRIAEQAQDWSLILVGDGPTRPATEQYITDNQLRNVSMEGYRSDIQGYCRDASILCMCSTFEGFPMVLPEAMCSGTIPMAFSSFAAIDDIFRDGVSGCKIEPFDEEAYANRLLQLMQDNALRHRMGRAAEEAATQFELGHILTQWCELIERL